MNSSKAAISVVHAPDSCSRTLPRSASVAAAGICSITRSRYASAAASGSMFIACSRGAPGTSRGSRPSCTPSISSRFDAGSVLTSSTLRPASASASAQAQASEVLPTPPLPVKNRKRGGFRSSDSVGN